MPPDPSQASVGAAPPPSPAKSSRRLQSAAEASQELHRAYDGWSAAVGKFALQAVFAMIAANWAVHGGARDGILSNAWARWSITIGLIYLTLVLALIARHAHMLFARHRHADSDRARWQQEFEKEGESEGTAWPYTERIEANGRLLQLIHVAAPIAMGALLVVSVFSPAATPAVGSPTSASQPRASSPSVASAATRASSSPPAPAGQPLAGHPSAHASRPPP